MNSVPALRTQYPDLGNALAKGAAIRGAEARTALNQSQNVLNQMRIQDYPEDKLRKRKMEDINYENKVLEIGTSYLKRVNDIADYAPYRQFMIEKFGVKPDILPPPESFNNDETAFDQFRDQATLTAQELILKNKAELGDKITISKIMADGRIQSQEINAKDYIKNRDKYPGYSVGKVSGTRTPQPKEATLYETEKGWQPTEKAIGIKKPTKTKQPTTAMGAYLQKYPDATSDEIAKYAQELKKSSSDTEKVPPKVKQAQSLVLKFAKQIDPTIATIIAMNPDMANSPEVKASLTSKIPDELRSSYNKSIQILDEYYGVPKEEINTDTNTSNITHEFIPGKGLVKIGE